MGHAPSAGWRSRRTGVLLDIVIMIVGVACGLLMLALASRTVLTVPSMRGYASVPYAVLSATSLLASAAVAVLVMRGSRRWLEHIADDRPSEDTAQKG
jgi:hypothetical protein